MSDIHIKRAYDDPADNDGERILVDGMWPRGVAKANARIDLWLKALAPSSELRKWFGHDPDKWDEFQRRYQEELKSDERAEAFDQLRERLDHGRVTLVFAAKDREHNNAVVLQQLLLADQ